MLVKFLFFRKMGIYYLDAEIPFFGEEKSEKLRALIFHSFWKLGKGNVPKLSVFLGLNGNLLEDVFWFGRNRTTPCLT